MTSVYRSVFGVRELCPDADSENERVRMNPEYFEIGLSL